MPQPESNPPFGLHFYILWPSSNTLPTTVKTVGGVETFQWNVSSTLAPASNYALEIVFTDGSSPTYSNQIAILAAGTTGTATAGVAATGVLNHPSSTAVATKTGAAVGGSSAASASSSSSSSSGNGGGGGKGLSGGDIAGIVIGVLGGIGLVLAAAFLFLRHRRKALALQHRQEPSMMHGEKRVSEFDASSTATRLELGGQEVGRLEKDGYEIR